MSTYYYADAECKVLKEELITTEAEKEGEIFAKILSSTQLRRFYHDVKGIEEQLKAKGYERWAEISPLVKMLKSKAAYAAGRGEKSKFPIKFKEFIDKYVDNIDRREDFEAFVKFFEAVVGYFYFYEKKNKEKVKEDVNETGARKNKDYHRKD